MKIIDIFVAVLPYIVCIIAIIGLALGRMAEDKEKGKAVEGKYCPKCGNRVENIFRKMGDIGLGITPMISYKKCKKCDWSDL